MKYKKFDIILVTFPFTDLREKKNRPAVIVKSLEGKNNILCQISTMKRPFQKYSIKLPRKTTRGNIKFDSYIYLDMIFTLHESLHLKKIGNIKDNHVKKEIDIKLLEMFS